MAEAPAGELPAALPAATVVVLRDGDAGVETLMLRRDSAVAFGGMWVFPGGKVDDDDRRPDDAGDEPAARRAAAREAWEETGLEVGPDELVAFSHWTPPALTRRRYATWFFLAAVPYGDVVIDGTEIRDHEWLAPGEVLRRRDEGLVDLAPPTWLTLHDLATVPDVAAALERGRARVPVPRYETRWVEADGGAVAMWEGDAGYRSGDPSEPGPRHRLVMRADGWSMEDS